MTKEKIQGQKDGLTCPKWRLYANFLHRELARLWYGKKNIFSLVKGDKEQEKLWIPFSFIWGAVVASFGETHGLTTDELTKRVESASKECLKLISCGVGVGLPFYIPFCFARRTLGDKLASEFLYDPQITEIAALAVYAYGYAIEGKTPQDVKGANLRPIEFYEGLPIAPELEELFYDKTN